MLIYFLIYRIKMKMKKKCKFIIVLIVLCIMLSTSAYAENEISVEIDGQKIDFDVQPQIINNRTMVPLRKIFESLGATVVWDGQTQTIVSILNDVNVKMVIGNPIISINGVDKTMDVSPIIKNNRTLVPARFVAEAFGAEVLWEETTRTVIINKTPKNIFMDGNINYINDSYFGITYSIPDILVKKDGDNNYRYYYYDKGFFMFSKLEMNIRELNEQCIDDIITGMSKSSTNFKLLSSKKCKVNEIDGYEIIQTAEYSNIYAYSKIILFLNNNNIYMISYSNYDDNVEYVDNEFYRMINSISIDMDYNKEKYDFTKIEDIKKYLEDTYPSIETEVGNIQFTPMVYENYDYDNNQYYSIHFEYSGSIISEINLDHFSKYTNEQKNKIKEQLKKFMKNIGLDLIDKLKDKRLVGRYYDSWYRYPDLKEILPLKDNLVTKAYCTWSNYDSSIGETIPSEFRWKPNLDTEIWITENDSDQDELYEELDSPSEIVSYLYDNYSSITTSAGKLNFTFSVLDKGDSETANYDYIIFVNYDKYEMNEVIRDFGKYTDEHKREAKEQLRSFMEKLAKDVIDRTGNSKKIEGFYHYSEYEYPYIKRGLIIKNYCNWSNYDDKSNGEVSYFRWNKNYDDKEWDD